MKKRIFISVLTRRGFSLIEGLVAIFVLSVGIVAIVNLFSQSATQANKDARRITAIGLAQEGAELVRVLHNDNKVKTTPKSFEGIDASDLCRVYKEDLIVKKNYYHSFDADNYKMGISDLSSPYYTYTTSGSNTFPSFWRRIYISPSNPGDPETRTVASVVFYKNPMAAAGGSPQGDWPEDITQVDAKCTVEKGCVFVKMILQE